MAKIKASAVALAAITMVASAGLAQAALPHALDESALGKTAGQAQRHATDHSPSAKMLSAPSAKTAPAQKAKLSRTCDSLGRRRPE